MVIRQRIPRDVISKRNVESYERRPPPASVTVVVTPRTPGPIVVVVDPTAVVIRRPTPGFIANPSPAIGPNPRPSAISIRRPVAVVVDDCDVGPPHPAVVVNVGPVAIGIKVL